MSENFPTSFHHTKSVFFFLIKQAFYIFFKRRLTRFWWKTKYCKSEKFQIGQNIGKFPSVFYRRLSIAAIALKACFFKNKSSFLNFFKKTYAFDIEKNIASPKSFFFWIMQAF